MSQNVFEIWKDNSEYVPFAVRRDNWPDYCYTVVVKIEIKKYPYGNAYGFPVRNGKYTDHYEYDKKWREHRIIPCAGCYQWSKVDVEIDKKLLDDFEKMKKTKDTNTDD